MRSLVLTCLALLLLVRPAPAEDQAPRFVAALFDERARVVRFEPLVGVDWETLARRHFRQFDIDRPGVDDLAFLRNHIYEISGDAEVTYRAPLDRDTRAGGFTLISAAGILPLRPAALEGTVRFEFDNATPPQMTGHRTFGVVVSRRLGAGEGGFVVRPARGTHVEQITGGRVALARDDARTVLSYEDEAVSGALVLPRRWHRKIEAAYGLRVGRKRYLFVAWPRDDDGVAGPMCAQNYAIYAIGPELMDVAHNNYDCDP
jgi:hypothetical protein